MEWAERLGGVHVCIVVVEDEAAADGSKMNGGTMDGWMMGMGVGVGA